MFKSDSDVEQGQIFSQGALSATSGESEVYAINPRNNSRQPIYGIFARRLLETNGNQYKVGDFDPRNFVNIAGITFDGYRIALGDKILMTAEGFSGAKGDSDTFAVATDATTQLVWGTSAGAGVSYSLDKTSYISIPSSTMGSQRVTAYQLRCVNV